MKVICDRKTNEHIEVGQYGEKRLEFLYNTFFGRILLKIVIMPFFSKINGIYNNTTFSKRKISKFVKKYNMNLTDYEKKEYKSFNDFFTRKKVGINIDENKSDFISPADSKLLIYKIKDELKVQIKNSTYTLSELLDCENDLEKYLNGYCLVFRLAMDDYHRYCFVDDGQVKNQKYIKGKLHTVSSISNKHKIYSQNSRICNYLKTDNFGDIIVIEVGALLVGKIKNHNNKIFKKGQEKGYFELGGSTIVILVQNNVKIDRDIIENSLNGIETTVKYGEKIGEKLC